KPAPKRRLPIVIGAVVVFVLAVAVGIWYFFVRPTQPPIETASVEKMAFPLPDRPSIAVLPFVNMSDDPEHEYFSDGMTDDLITDLSKISGLFVVARNSAFTYKEKPVKIRQVAEELGVRYVLEGSVRRDENMVRINAQLLDATTGGHLWAERYDEQMEKIFSLQDKITQKIVKSLALTLTGSEQENVASKETDSIEAYDTFMQGWKYYRRFTPDDFVKAVSFFETAIELDRNYWLSYAALASVYWESFQRGRSWALPLGVNKREAFRRADKYLEIAMNNPTPLAYQVATEWHIVRAEHDEAITAAQRAIALDPNDPRSHLAMGLALIFAGRHREAVVSIKRAMRLDPFYGVTIGNFNLCMAYFHMEQFEEAATLCEKALTHNPENFLPLWYLGAAYGHLGREQEAKAALAKLREKEPRRSRLRSLGGDLKLKNPSDVDLFVDGWRKAGMK
ncbi:MAG: tetratricopeptide repeat protein, partial [Deltaproteobacteria bacterium]